MLFVIAAFAACCLIGSVLSAPPSAWIETRIPSGGFSANSRIKIRYSGFSDYDLVDLVLYDIYDPVENRRVYTGSVAPGFYSMKLSLPRSAENATVAVFPYRSSGSVFAQCSERFSLNMSE